MSNYESRIDSSPYDSDSNKYECFLCRDTGLEYRIIDTKYHDMLAAENLEPMPCHYCNLGTRGFDRGDVRYSSK